jgi:hypothetical protein
MNAIGFNYFPTIKNGTLYNYSENKDLNEGPNS